MNRSGDNKFMKKRFLVMAVCVSACMPVSALGAEIAGPAISGYSDRKILIIKKKQVSEEANRKKDSGKIEGSRDYGSPGYCHSSGRYRCIRLSWQKRGFCDR